MLLPGYESMLALGEGWSDGGADEKVELPLAVIVFARR
jgi:hypothetical protein